MSNEATPARGVTNGGPESAPTGARYAQDLHRRLQAQGWDLAVPQFNALTKALLHEVGRLFTDQEYRRDIPREEASRSRATVRTVIHAVDAIRDRRARSTGGR